MTRYAAFLRGMNVGGRRLKNDELCRHIENLGFVDVAAFLASGNVVLTDPEASSTHVGERLAQGLEAALDYSVPTFLRSGAELTAIAERHVFPQEVIDSAGKPQIAFLQATPSAEAQALALAFSSDQDRLQIHGSELHWLPAAGLSDSTLDLKTLEKILGTMTIRTERTVVRMVAKFFT